MEKLTRHRPIPNHPHLLTGKHNILMRRTQYSNDKLPLQSPTTKQITCRPYYPKDKSNSLPKTELKFSPAIKNINSNTIEPNQIYHSEYFDKQTQKNTGTKNKKQRKKEHKGRVEQEKEEKRIQKAGMDKTERKCLEDRRNSRNQAISKQNDNQNEEAPYFQVGNLSRLQSNSVFDSNSPASFCVKNIAQKNNVRNPYKDDYQMMTLNRNMDISLKNIGNRLKNSLSSRSGKQNMFILTGNSKKSSKHKIRADLSKVKSSHVSPSNTQTLSSLKVKKSFRNTTTKPNNYKIKSLLIKQQKFQNNNSKAQKIQIPNKNYSSHPNNIKLNSLYNSQPLNPNKLKNTNRISLLLQSKYKSTANYSKNTNREKERIYDRDNGIFYGVTGEEEKNQVRSAQEFLETVETHVFIVKIMWEYCIQVSNFHEDEESGRLDTVIVCLYQKTIREIEKMINILQSERVTDCPNPFTLSSVCISIQAIQQYRNYDIIKNFLIELKQELRQLYEQLQKKSSCLKETPKCLQIGASKKDLQKFLAEELFSEILYLGECLQNSRISEDGYVQVQDLLIETVEVLYILSELSGKKVRKIIFAEQVRNFELYYEQNVDIVQEIADFFKNIQ